MRVAILSTDTPHHRYFINSIAKEFGISALIFYAPTSINTHIPWFKEQMKLEHQVVRSLGLYDLPLEPFEVWDINCDETRKKIHQTEADIGLVFGTPKLQPFVFEAPKWGSINIHRGISQHYRGLDSELWAILNGDFDNIGITLHYIDKNLDTGNIIAQARFAPEPGMAIHQMRLHQTMQATSAMLRTLEKTKALGPPPGQPQEKGKYYSAMGISDMFDAWYFFDEWIEGLSV